MVVWAQRDKTLFLFFLVAINDVAVKKEAPSPVNTCSFDEGFYSFVTFSQP